MQNTSLTIVLPSYNESDNLVALLNSIYFELNDSLIFKIIVVDDGSTDGTRNQLLAFCKDKNWVKLIFNDHRIGLAESIYLGILESESDFIAVMDSDGMHDPSYLLPLYEQSLKSNSLAIASRYIKGGSSIGNLYPILSKFINIIIRIIMDSKIKDQLCGYFIAPTSEILEIKKSYFVGFGEYFIMVIKHFEIKGAVNEIPSVHKVRVSGKRKSKRVNMVFKYLTYAIKNR
jgi:dolichol-phosphate mannosyltransferase